MPLIVHVVLADLRPNDPQAEWNDADPSKGKDSPVH